ncbi:MAG TPA: sigma-70 family RNA polymerase sigma factor, partial [Ktedonobacterales bacterium]|nr:sigma-70 family RNA polymerase sigma factor [Ktedonobacterales bacterium]
MARRDSKHSQASGAQGERPDRPAALPANLDEMLAASRPQLLHIARALGNPPDVAEDIVQETLLEALDHLYRVYSFAGFDRWLKAICRNICHRYARERGVTWRRQANLPNEDIVPLRLTSDPFETLDRWDRMQLLERAMHHLPMPARTAVERCYVEDQPQRAVAAQLGITIKALEARLLRARRQLRDLLNGELRDEAEALDLLPAAEPSLGWRETRQWCNDCGCHRLRGIFTPLSDGRINLRLRCPNCSPQYDIDMVYSGGVVPLDGYHAFKPAFKRMQRILFPYYREGVKQGKHRCIACGRMIPVRIVTGDEIPIRTRKNEYLIVERCQCSHDSLAGAAGV